MLTSNQQIVFDWLNDKLQLPVFAEVYKGALDLLKQRVPGYVTFVSHAGRDLMNSLARTVQGITRQQVQYVQLVDAFKDDWRNEWGGEGFDGADSDENGHLIPYKICEKINSLIHAHKAGHLRPIEASALFFTTFLDYDDREKIPQNFMKEWRDAREWFVKHAHLREVSFRENASSEVERHFKNLDNFLYVAASSEFGRLRSIHEILEETNQ